jgi:hypothetical protein
VSMTNRVEIGQNYKRISTKLYLWFKIVIVLHNSFILVPYNISVQKTHQMSKDTLNISYTGAHPKIQTTNRSVFPPIEFNNFNVVCMLPQLLLKLETCWRGNTIVIMRLCRVRLRVATVRVPQFINLQTSVRGTWVNFGLKASTHFFRLKFPLHRYWLIFCLLSTLLHTYFIQHKKHNTTMARQSKQLAVGG